MNYGRKVGVISTRMECHWVFLGGGQSRGNNRSGCRFCSTVEMAASGGGGHTHWLQIGELELFAVWLFHVLRKCNHNGITWNGQESEQDWTEMEPDTLRHLQCKFLPCGDQRLLLIIQREQRVKSQLPKAFRAPSSNRRPLAHQGPSCALSHRWSRPPATAPRRLCVGIAQAAALISAMRRKWRFCWGGVRATQEHL